MLSGVHATTPGLNVTRTPPRSLFCSTTQLTVFIYFISPQEGLLFILKTSPLFPRCLSDPPRLGRIHSRVARVLTVNEQEAGARGELRVNDGGFPRRPRQLRVSQTRVSVLLRRGSPSHPSLPGPYFACIGYLVPHNGDPQDFSPGINDVLKLASVTPSLLLPP